jgi:hypothetical protein
MTTHQSWVTTATEERLALQVQLAELARRMAESEFGRLDGQEWGWLTYNQALQICLKEIEHPTDLSYQVEDVRFLPDFTQIQPSSQVGPAWQFNIRGSTGRFSITIDAMTGQAVFKNKLG